jgi:hypothetical protein
MTRRRPPEAAEAALLRVQPGPVRSALAELKEQEARVPGVPRSPMPMGAQERRGHPGQREPPGY